MRAALKNHLNECGAYQDVEVAGTEAFRYAHYVEDCLEDVEGALESQGVAVEIVKVSLICETTNEEFGCCILDNRSRSNPAEHTTARPIQAGCKKSTRLAEQNSHMIPVSSFL